MVSHVPTQTRVFLAVPVLTLLFLSAPAAFGLHENRHHAGYLHHLHRLHRFRHHNRHFHSRHHGRHESFRFFHSPIHDFRYHGSRHFFLPRTRHHHPFGFGRSLRFYSSIASIEDPAADTPTIGSSNGDAHSRSGDAWALLSSGQPFAALQAFATVAQADPRNGVPKVGYALAAALSGDAGRAVWAMRRAFRIDPDGLRYVEIDADLSARVQDLLAQYGESHATADEAFMAGALHFLLGDGPASGAAVKAAIDRGDESESTRQLQRLVQELGADAPDTPRREDRLERPAERPRPAGSGAKEPDY